MKQNIPYNPIFLIKIPILLDYNGDTNPALFDLCHTRDFRAIYFSLLGFLFDLCILSDILKEEWAVGSVCEFCINQSNCLISQLKIINVVNNDKKIFPIKKKCRKAD